MRHHLCEWHNYDGDERGWSMHAYGAPDPFCAACRAQNLCTEEAMAAADKAEAEAVSAATSQVRASNGATLRVTPVGGQGTIYSKHYRVELVEGQWPPKEEIISLSDNFHPLGGVVLLNGDIADVSINGTD